MQNVITGDSIEKIAIERVTWASKCAGLESLFIEIDKKIKAFERHEDVDPDDVPKETKKKRIVNPHRQRARGDI